MGLGIGDLEWWDSKREAGRGWMDVGTSSLKKLRREPKKKFGIYKWERETICPFCVFDSHSREKGKAGKWIIHGLQESFSSNALYVNHCYPIRFQSSLYSLF